MWNYDAHIKIKIITRNQLVFRHNALWSLYGVPISLLLLVSVIVKSSPIFITRSITHLSRRELRHTQPGQPGRRRNGPRSKHVTDKITTYYTIVRVSTARTFTLLAVASLVMSPWSWVTPGSGAMACRSTATIFTSSRSSSGRCGHNIIIISTLNYVNFCFKLFLLFLF